MGVGDGDGDGVEDGDGGRGRGCVGWGVYVNMGSHRHFTRPWHYATGATSGAFILSYTVESSVHLSSY